MTGNTLRKVDREARCSIVDGKDPGKPNRSVALFIPPRGSNIAPLSIILCLGISLSKDRANLKRARDTFNNPYGQQSPSVLSLSRPDLRDRVVREGDQIVKKATSSPILGVVEAKAE